MTKHLSKALLLGVVIAGLTGLQPAFAGFANGDNVTMGDQSIFQMAAAGGFSGHHRAWMAQDALDNALVLATDRSPSAVTVERENGAVTVVLNGRKIATVDSNSAEQAHLTVAALAERWAESLRNVLTDTNLTGSYVATLKNNQLVNAEIVRLERTMYAPAGLSFQVKLTSALSSDVKEGDLVEGTIDHDVALGNYVIPAGATVIGKVFEDNSDNFSIRFQSIKTSSGRMCPIDGIVSEEYAVNSKGPHRVCTYVIPSGMANGVPMVAGRIPAGIGIGAVEKSGFNALVFHRNTANTLVAGRLLNLQLETTTPIAVVVRERLM